MGFDDPRQIVQRFPIKSETIADDYIWYKPELGVSISLSNVNMGGFAWIPLVRIEEKTKSILSENDRHFRLNPSRTPRR